MHANPGFHLNSVVRAGSVIGVTETVVAERPFCTLRRFQPDEAGAKPSVLIVAPISGQYATLLRDAVTGLVADHSVYITDWTDANQVPLAVGKFDLEDNIATIVGFVRDLGPDLHVLAVCQSAAPALAAVALLAASRDRLEPRSLVLMGGLIDTRISPTRIHRWANSLSFRMLEAGLITVVPFGFPGAMRRVYPAAVQRAALLAYLARHSPLAGGFVDPALSDPYFVRELLTVMDVPAELYLQNIAAVLQDHLLPRGLMRWQGRKVRPQSIRRTALMTVEGEYDDISGAGQTRAAHDLCPAIAPHRRRHLVQRGVGHFGMYAGRIWFGSVLPQVAAFIRAQCAGSGVRSTWGRRSR